MRDILSDYDVLGAFWVTIQLSRPLGRSARSSSAPSSPILRVSPVAVLRGFGTCYVNIVRNTPLTLLMVFSVLGTQLHPRASSSSAPT